MKPVEAAGLNAWHDEIHRRRDSRLLEHRFFAGWVASVTASPGAGPAPYQVQIQRVGESQADGNTYTCAVPGYCPQVGDLVELVWRDRDTAHVLIPLGSAFGNTGPARFAKVVVQSAQWIGARISAATSFTVFLPAPYKTIEVIWQANATADANVSIQVNQDTTANYFGNRWVVNGATGTGFQDNGLTSNSVGMVPATATFGSGRITIHNRTGSHGISWESSSQANYYAGATGSMTAGGIYAGSGPLTSITLAGPAFMNGQFDFYGYPA